LTSALKSNPYPLPDTQPGQAGTKIRSTKLETNSKGIRDRNLGPATRLPPNMTFKSSAGHLAAMWVRYYDVTHQVNSLEVDRLKEKKCAITQSQHRLDPLAGDCVMDDRY
jgi:hypothetical protein